MAGHSKFKNIMHRKGRQTLKRAKVFGPNKELPLPRGRIRHNPRLQLAMAAKAQNMPNDNIQRELSEPRAMTILFMRKCDTKAMGLEVWLTIVES